MFNQIVHRHDNIKVISTCSLEMGFVNGTQFLNTTLVFSLPPVAVMSLVARIYESQ